MNYENLDTLCEINIGKTPSRNNENYWNGEHKWIAISDMKNKYISETKQKISNLAIDECNMKIINSGTVIMSFKLTIGKVAITAEDIYSNEAIASFNIKNSNILDKNYLYYALQTINYSKNTDRAVMGVTLNKAKLRQLAIPLPSIGTQKNIVKILDLVQNLVNKRKEQLAEMDRLIQSVFYEMFTKDTLSFVLLNDFVSHVTSGATPKGGSSVYKTSGIPFIRSQNVLMNKIDYSDIAYIDKSTHESMKRSQLYKNDILLNITGASIGRVAVYTGENGEANTNQHVASLRIDQTFYNPFFLSYYMSTEYFQKMIENESSGGTRQALNYSQIKKFNIPKVPIELQNKFAIIVEEIEAQKKIIEQSLTEMENNFNALMQKAFKGELFPE